MAKEVETNKEGLQVIADRYGIVSYNDATAIVVNSVDKEKADEALTKAEVTHRVFPHPFDLADELLAEKSLRHTICEMEISEEEKESIPIIEREKFAISEVDVANSVGKNAISYIDDAAIEYVKELRGYLNLEEAKEEASTDEAEEPTKDE